MKVLIVGGNGFLGREITERLTADAFEVHVVSRSSKSDSNWQQSIGDLSAPDSYMPILLNWCPDVVIQAAWVTEQRTYRTDLKNNDYGIFTTSFAEQCFRQGVRHFLAFGSAAEYGSQTNPCNAVKSLASPLDLYGKSKLRTLMSLQELTKTDEQKLTWARVFQAYGHTQDSARFIPQLAKKLLSGENIMLNNPDLYLDWVTSRDIARAVSFSLSHDLPEVIDIGTSIGTTVREVYQKIAALVGREPHLPLSRAKDDQESSSLIVSPDSPIFSAGWAPKDNLDTGLLWALSL